MLINREKLLDSLPKDEMQTMSVSHIKDLIYSMAEVEGVILCKDCIHWNGFSCSKNANGMIVYSGNPNGTCVNRHKKFGL